MEEHPLQNSWVLWHDIKWNDLKEVQSFGTVENFWLFFNKFPPPTQIEHMHNLRLFIQGIHPSCEDVANAQGGKWIVQFYSKSNIDEVWLNFVLDLIGHTMQEHWQINGLELNIRHRGHRLSVWTGNCDLDLQKSLGQYLLDESGRSVVSISFKNHKDIVETKSLYGVKPLLIIK
jgi:translation initiation factor 4E